MNFVTCSGCRRSVKVPERTRLSTPLCIYCGTALQLDAAGMEDFRRAQEAGRKGVARQVQRLHCPVCARMTVLRGDPGDPECRCLICASPIHAGAEGRAIPGTTELLLENGIDADDREACRLEAEAALGLEAMLAEVGGWNGLSPAVALALDALLWRLANGHASPDEAHETFGALIGWCLQRRRPRVPVAGEDTDLRFVPLPPAWAADLIAGDIETNNTHYHPREDGGALVRIVTGSHRETDGDAAAALAVTVAATLARGAPMFVTGPDRSLRYDVQHYLDLEFFPADGGSLLLYSHHTATDHPLEISQEMREWVDTIRSGVELRGEHLLCLKAVFGGWVRARLMRMVDPVCLRDWLARLSPDLGEDAHVLVQQ